MTELLAVVYQLVEVPGTELVYAGLIPQDLNLIFHIVIQVK
jgi:hypothetical protein